MFLKSIKNDPDKQYHVDALQIKNLPQSYKSGANQWRTLLGKGNVIIYAKRIKFQYKMKMEKQFLKRKLSG
jgi:hypothetical protein